jgi:hypothetical protein
LVFFAQGSASSAGLPALAHGSVCVAVAPPSDVTNANTAVTNANTAVTTANTALSATSQRPKLLLKKTVGANAMWNHKIVKLLKLSPQETLRRFRKDFHSETLTRQFAAILSHPVIKLLNTPNYVEFVAKNFLLNVDPVKADARIRDAIRVLIVKVPQLRALIIAPRELVEQIYTPGRIPKQIFEEMAKEELAQVLHIASRLSGIYRVLSYPVVTLITN